MEVGLGPGQMAGWIKIPLGTEVGLGPGDIVLDRDAAPPQKGAQQPPPTFWPMFVLDKRSPISATAELLLSNFAEFLRNIEILQ